MKLPNGFGSIHKLSGNRRNPWRARKTKGWVLDEKTGVKKQVYETIGYYPTQKEALQALSNYNENPYDIKTNSITFAEVYEKFTAEHFEKITPSATRSIKSAYHYSEPLYNMRMKDIRVIHLESTIKNAKVSSNLKGRMKSLFNLMYRYALKHEIVDKDYAHLCETVKQSHTKTAHTPFTDEEEKLLWENQEFPYVKMLLIGIYSGWRPQELSILKNKDIDLEAMTMLGGLKTDAGKNRIVPIHSKVKPLIESLYNEDSEYLFNDKNGQKGTYMSYDKYRRKFEKICTHFNLNHRPHDTRHTFITKAKNANVDEYVLKLIVGHAIADVTEKIYTHRTIESLRNEIEKIK
jgi:integrase